MKPIFDGYDYLTIYWYDQPYQYSRQTTPLVRPQGMCKNEIMLIEYNIKIDCKKNCFQEAGNYLLTINQQK